MRSILVTVFLLSLTSGGLAQTAPRAIPGKCLLSIFVDFQAARPHCKTSSPALDAAVDETLAILEKRLIEVGEATAELVDTLRADSQAAWREISASQIAAACQASSPVSWAMTLQSLGEIARSIQAAPPDRFTDACI